MNWQPIETAPKDGSLILLGAPNGVWVGKHLPVYTSGFAPKNPWSSMLLNHDHMAERYTRPTHWMPLPAAPGAPVGTNAAPSGWRTVIDNHCDRLLDTEPSSYDSQGYRDFARSVLDSVADELSALEADPATKRQEAEAIKAEFLERTGQYLTNDASREACIAEAVAAEREAAAPYARDAMRYRMLRRGQHWSVIDWKGDILRGDELDLTIDAKNEDKAAAKESP